MTTFGLASTAFRSHRLGARDLDAMKAAGFDVLDLVAVAGHVELADVAQLDDIVRTSRDAGVDIRSVAVLLGDLPATTPIAVDRGWPLVIGRAGPCRVIESRGDAPSAIAPILEKVAPWLPERGVSVAIQAPGGRALACEAIVATLESIDDPRFGVCLDTGHAHLSGGAPEAAEAASGLCMAALLHDNNGREDSHRAPGEGAINWPAVLTACWKTGFSGPWIIEVTDEPGRPDTVTRAVSARARLQAILEDLAQPMTFTE
jgi:sugar phosphate isomerase/epimerase